MKTQRIITVVIITIACLLSVKNSPVLGYSSSIHSFWVGSPDQIDRDFLWIADCLTSQSFKHDTACHQIQEDEILLASIQWRALLGPLKDVNRPSKIVLSIALVASIINYLTHAVSSANHAKTISEHCDLAKNWLLNDRYGENMTPMNATEVRSEITAVITTLSKMGCL